MLGKAGEREWMAGKLRLTVVTVGSMAVLLTAAPLVPSNQWWIRIWDFPRLQLAVVLLVVLIAVPFVMPLRRRRSAAFAGIVVLALGWQAYRIAPYTPLHHTEAEMASSCEADSRLRLLAINVKAGNENADPVLALIRRVGPDLLLLVETDSWWDRHLEPLKSAYPHVVSQPQDNGYGIHLFSRFELVAPEVRFLVEKDVPSIKTGVSLPSGDVIDFYGLHPKPPPIQDTAERDAELLIVGGEVRKEAASSIVAGDLNDVAWSPTNRLFQEISGLLDPRIGRGPYATFNANWPLLRWPLDHVFFEDAFGLLEMAVLPNVGSDHFPFFVSLCHFSTAASVGEQPQAEPSELEAAEEAIEEGHEEAAE